MSEHDGRGRRLGAAGFLALQALLVSAAVAWGTYRVREMEAERVLPPLRAEPLQVKPLYDDPEVIRDEPLRRVLSRLGLRLEGADTSIGHVDHALRLWGADAELADPEVLSGSELRRLLTDHSRFVEVYGRERPPLLMDDGNGVRVRVQEGNASSAHFDHTVACLAEAGTPLDFPLVTPRRRTTLRAMVERSMREFSLNQTEYEWSALTFALYLPPANRWISTEGQEISFDRLADRIRREELPNGVCAANHRLYALVVFLRVDDQMRAAGEAPILSPESRRGVLDYLAEVTAMLVRNQHPDGFWNRDWPTSTPPGSEPSDREGDSMSDRLIATGHALEWWAMAPEELHPPRPVVVAAAQWLVAAIDRMSDEEIDRYYTYLSHVGRALALWRGRFPAEVELS
jgi:hypothetical protein